MLPYILTLIQSFIYNNQSTAEFINVGKQRKDKAEFIFKQLKLNKFCFSVVSIIKLLYFIK